VYSRVASLASALRFALFERSNSAKRSAEARLACCTQTGRASYLLYWLLALFFARGILFTHSNGTNKEFAK